ncbi:MAG: CDP-glycerol glycerophosphotransferase family protein, partial [Oscillospiraceae bacterium]
MLKSFGIKVKKKLKKLYNYIASRTYKFLTLRLYYPGYYRWHAKKPIQEKKVLFCEVRSLAITDSFKLLIEKFAREGYTTECHCLGETNVGVVSYAKNSLRFLKSMATARYVCISDACNVTSCVEKRPETILVQLWHACGAFKKFGYSTAELIFGVNRKQMDRYPYYKNLNYITVSSPEVSWAYEEAMNSEKFGSKVVATGVSRTDVFFDESFTEDARATLYTAVPQARGKKLILYAPTFRGGVRSAKSPDVLDIADLREALGDDYFLLIKHHPFVRHPP